MLILNGMIFCLHTNNIKSDVNLLNHFKWDIHQFYKTGTRDEERGTEWSYRYRAQICNSFTRASKLLGTCRSLLFESLKHCLSLALEIPQQSDCQSLHLLVENRNTNKISQISQERARNSIFLTKTCLEVTQTAIWLYNFLILYLFPGEGKDCLQEGRSPGGEGTGCYCMK